MRITISNDYRQLEKEIADIPSRFARGEGKVIYEGRNSVREFVIGGISMVAKRFKKVNPFQQVAYTFFRKTKAERAFRYARIFRERGIETPHEVAFIEEKRHGLFTVGYFISLSCPDPPAFPALVPPAEYDRLLATDLAGFIVTMHAKGILHGDLNFGNFLYREKKDGHYGFTVIDTNRSAFCNGWPDDERCIENLSKMTHRRDLFDFMTGEYARQRGWNAADTIARSRSYLVKLEQKHERKQRFKQLLKR